MESLQRDTEPDMHPRRNIIQRSAVSAIACDLRDGHLTPRQAAEQMKRWSVPLRVALRVIGENSR